ncbi:hypothetical protein [Acidianus manzaensis]|uniref:Succinate dehydrogenase n=1 Tax=Acidianus manzaensis TaxID=282676 RepID=A0A1W6JYH2_9CREN|nr:hypothetical protein [Acidianus manzaensis]ARM75319.1 hypothetical protein B6F84_04245 [Acidianus manzaensis]
MNEAKIRLIFYIFGILASIFLAIHLSMLFITPMNFTTRTSTRVINNELVNKWYVTSLLLLLVFSYSHATLGLRRTLHSTKFSKYIITLLWISLLVLIYIIIIS